MAEQIPGTLFVLLVALAAYMLDDARPVLILALACAAGWQTFNPNPTVANLFRVVALILWVCATFLVTYRMV